VNQEIKAPMIRVIGSEGAQLGIIPLQEGLKVAREGGLDLVEVAPQADPPVCRIMDYGKFKYQQSKKIQEAKKKQTIIHVKEVKLRPNTESHDLETKLRHVRKFLEKKNKTKISLLFRGREIIYLEAAKNTLHRIAESIKDIGVVEQQPRLEGRNMNMIIAPK
jgi:translation initiation factor IF-3